MTNPNDLDVTPPPEPTGSAGDGNLATPMKLKSFLEGIAMIYDLPERRRKAKAASHPLKKKQGPVLSPARQTALLAAAAVTAIVWAVDGIRKPPAEFGILPQAINGGWHTSDKRYGNRAFWIKGDRVAFQTGRDSLEFTVHKITQVDQKILAGDTLQYTVQYLVDGAATTWAIQYIQRPKPMIRFVNQRELVWTPAPNSAWPAQ